MSDSTIASLVVCALFGFGFLMLWVVPGVRRWRADCRKAARAAKRWHIFYSAAKEADAGLVPTYHVFDVLGTTPPVAAPDLGSPWACITHIGYDDRALAVEAAQQLQTHHREEIERCTREKLATDNSHPWRIADR